MIVNECSDWNGQRPAGHAVSETLTSPVAVSFLSKDLFPSLPIGVISHRFAETRSVPNLEAGFAELLVVYWSFFSFIHANLTQRFWKAIFLHTELFNLGDNLITFYLPGLNRTPETKRQKQEKNRFRLHYSLLYGALSFVSAFGNKATALDLPQSASNTCRMPSLSILSSCGLPRQIPNDLDQRRHDVRRAADA